MSANPSNIWIARAAATMPEWVMERMTTGDVAADGSFDLETPDGSQRVANGDAVFEFRGEVYACPTRLVQAKLAEVAGGGPEAIRAIEEKAAARKQREAESRARFKPTNDAYELKLKPIVGVPPSPQFVAIDSLKVDDTYQRSIEGGASRKLIIKIAENWDWRLCLPLIVSRRRGELYVIDGQHRMEGAVLRGDIPHLPVVIFDFDRPEEEAELFIAANRSRRAMGVLDDHHAAVVAGDRKAVAINEVVTGAGLTVGRLQAWQHWKPGEVVFVKAISRLMHSQGKEVVSTSLKLITQAFEGQVLLGASAIFEALVTFIKRRTTEGAPPHEDLLVMVLSQTGIAGWKEAVDGIDGAAERTEAMLSAITEAYNEAEAE